MPKKQIGIKIDADGNTEDLGFTLSQEEMDSLNGFKFLGTFDDDDSLIYTLDNLAILKTLTASGQYSFALNLKESTLNYDRKMFILIVNHELFYSTQTVIGFPEFTTFTRTYTYSDSSWTSFTQVDILARRSSIPTNNNQLTNGANYVTNKLGTTNWKVSQDSSGNLVFTYE